jgi:hypothetical protein
MQWYPPLMSKSYASFVLRRVSPGGDNSLQTRVLPGRPRSERERRNALYTPFHVTLQSGITLTVRNNDRECL